MTANVKIENGSFDPDHAPFWGGFVIRELGIYYIVYLCIKFDDNRFSHSRDITGGPIHAVQFSYKFT